MMLAVSSLFWIYVVQTHIFPRRKRNIWVKQIIGGKRQDKDKSIYLFLETGKSSV